MILHANNAAKRIFPCSYKHSDTDVVVISISFVHRIAVEELWIAFGTDKHFRYIPVHKKAAVLGNGICTASPVFRASTGCDKTSSFVSKGKSLPGTHGMLFSISLVL